MNYKDMLTQNNMIFKISKVWLKKDLITLEKIKILLINS